MKIVKTLLIASAALASASSFASESAEKFKFIGAMKYSSFCEAILTDDVSLLKVSLSRQVGELASTRKDVLGRLMNEDGMTCNGSNLLDFAKERKASEVAEYLAEQLG